MRDKVNPISTVSISGKYVILFTQLICFAAIRLLLLRDRSIGPVGKASASDVGSRG
ncbi:hypothetical protein CHS0354_027486, partial [Potamilus streckersoni]